MRINVEVENCLVNGQQGNIKHIDFAYGNFWKKKFSDKQTGLKAMRSFYSGRQNWVLIGKCETEIPINQGIVSPSITCTQFPLTFTSTPTIHKFQGLSVE